MNKKYKILKLFWFVGWFLVISVMVPGVFQRAAEATVYIADSKEKISVFLLKLQAGDTLEIASGKYAGGIDISNLNGMKNAPITIKGKDPEKPPVFIGGNNGFTLRYCNFVHLRNLKISGAKENGLNIDDGNTSDEKNPPSTNILMDGLVIENTGPVGNADAIKMSGVQRFVVQNCKISGWGGSGIDMVGCSFGRVSRCRFVGKKGFSQGNGIQIKGGSHGILVEKCFFNRSGRRGINLGGSTGYRWFRPKVGYYEAKNIEIAGNIFYGGTAIGFVTSQKGFVHHNAILYPSGYVFRILQESEDIRFQPCGNSIFMKNIIVVDKRLKNYVNIGKRTNPQSFIFSENVWYDEFSNRKPNLPSFEKNPVYQVNPHLVVKKGKIFFRSKDQRLIGKGPAYYKGKL